MAWRHALWRRVIEAKYGNVWGCWCTKNVTSAYGDSPQRFISRAGWTFLNSYNMMWVMVLEWSFGSMCSVGIVPSKRPFQNSIVLVGQGNLHWRRLCVGLLGGFIGMFNFVDHRKIGSKNLSIYLWIWSILWLCGGLVLTRFVGSQQVVEVLRLEDFIFLCTLLLSYPSLGEWCGN